MPGPISFDMLRTGLGTDPVIWIRLLREKAGWTLLDVNTSRVHGATIAVLDHEGSMIPVVLSAAAYSPGDPDDQAIQKLQRSCEKAERAIIISNMPVMVGEGPSTALFGGLYLSEGRWSEFYLNDKGASELENQRLRVAANPGVQESKLFRFRESAAWGQFLAKYIFGPSGSRGQFGP